ncbi:MAG: Maf family protein [Actinomycetota bacterium]
MSRVGQGVPEFVLASASPRRLELLRAIGVQPTVRAAAVDERPLDGETPAQLVERLAVLKATTVARSTRPSVDGDDPTSTTGAGDRLSASTSHSNSVVLGADTVIDLDGRILAKAESRSEAEAMLRALSGRDHDVISGMALVGRVDGRAVEVSAVERTTVTMRALTEDDIAWYLGTGDYEGKAGSYAIQGLGGLFVDRIDGSYTNVVGLSVAGLDRLFGAAGMALRDLVAS